jgi:hypothetical protein
LNPDKEAGWDGIGSSPPQSFIRSNHSTDVPQAAHIRFRAAWSIWRKRLRPNQLDYELFLAAADWKDAFPDAGDFYPPPGDMKTLFDLVVQTMCQSETESFCDDTTMASRVDGGSRGK